jgi:hypothetical protein
MSVLLPLPYIPYLRVYKPHACKTAPRFLGQEFGNNNNSTQAALDFTCVKVKYLRLHLRPFGCLAAFSVICQ